MLLSATGELRHFYKNRAGEAPTFFSKMGESALGIEIGDRKKVSADKE
jgi:hypothetical protein